MPLHPWFQEFLTQNRQKDDWNYTSLISMSDSVSDGINHLPAPTLYRRMVSDAISHTTLVNGYTQSAGHPLLVYGLMYYERVLAGENASEEGFAKYVRITAGASAAIQMVLSYYANTRQDGAVLLCGMSYYLFRKSCLQNGLTPRVLCRDGGLLPDAESVCAAMRSRPGACVVITCPANPTGEVYAAPELERILAVGRETNCLMLLDLCQYDELVMGSGTWNPGACVCRARAQAQTVLISSFSKIRAIAGARIGYLVTQNEELSDYAEYCSEMLYFNHTLGYEYAIAADLFYRTILRLPPERHKAVIRDFRNIILQTAGVSCFQTVFRPILRSETLLQEAEAFRRELLETCRVVNENYQYCRDTLLPDEGFSVSRLDGGYNFCVRIPLLPGEREEACKRRLSSAMGTGILSQEAFCLPASEDADRIWIRLSAAMAPERFQSYIQKLKEWGTTNGTK